MNKIGLVQINNSFSGQNYFPYSIGIIQAYALQHCKTANEFEFIDPIYKRMSVKTAVEKLKNCDVIGFSLYVWNEKISLKIAKELRNVNPNCFIVMGGPQVPDKAEEWLRLNSSFVDIAVHGEGEHVFTLILEKLSKKSSDVHWKSLDWSDIPGISYLNNDRFITNAKKGRFKTLDEIPSPYLSGMFDNIIKQNPEEQWLALWETNRGCPFQCTYCDWGSAIQVKISKFDEQRLYKEIDWFSDHKIEFIFCCDANYGILVRDIDITKYVVDSKLKKGYPKALSVQNTKNATDRSYTVQKMLSDAGLNKGVTLSVQSMDTTTLKNIKRDNISLESYQELQRRFMKDKVETYSDMILAMPGETYESFTNGIDQIITNGQHNRIQFNNLSILPNAEMGNPEYQKKFGMVKVVTDIINFHGSLDEEIEDPSIREKQVLVVGTDSMPKEDWLKTRAYCWMTALLHFDKLLQIPIVLFHNLTGLKYKQIFDAFMDENRLKKWSVLWNIREFFVWKAKDIQMGGSEYCESKEWLNIWWPADEYIFIRLAKGNQIDKFYEECFELLSELALENNKESCLEPLKESIQLNRALLKLPFQLDNVEVNLNYDIMSFYRTFLEEGVATLNKTPTTYKIQRTKTVYMDWNDWYKEVVWYGNKKGAYLYGNWETVYQLSGHH